MVRRTRPWPRLCLSIIVLANLVVALAPLPHAAATFPGSNGRIVFPSASHGGLWTVAADGTGPRRLAPGDYPEFSPDGTRVVSVRGGTQIWVMRSDGTQQRELPSTVPDCNFISGTTWSADGTKIAFSKSCGNVSNIFVTNVDGSTQPTRLTTFDAFGPSWSPDGTKIAFEAESDVWVMDADGTDPVQLTNDGDNRVVHWAPDSQRLIFGRRGPGDDGARIYVMNANGTGLTALTPDDPNHDADPVFSPDGTRFAFIEQEHLHLADANGSNVTEFAPTVEGTIMRAYAPDWGVGRAPAGGFEFSAETFEASEDGGSARLIRGALITVVRTGNTAGPANVLFATTDGSAKSSRTIDCLRCKLSVPDYLTATGVLGFADGETTKTFRVPIIDDGLIEGDETVNLVLKRFERGPRPLASSSTAVLTIHDNDPNISFQRATSKAPEGDGSAAITVLLSAPVENASVAYAVTGGTATGADYTLAAGTLSFRTRSQAIPLRVIDDNLKEQSETIQVELSAPAKAQLGPISVHTFTIADDDPNGDVAGDTPATAMALDLAAQPRQFVGESLFPPGDADVYRVHLEAEDDVAIDVDGVGPIGTAIRSSTLTILGSDGTTELASVGGSPEPDGNGSTGNPAHLFQAPATGDYYLRLSDGVGKYRMELHRLAVAEGRQDPRALDRAGPMFAWLRGDTLGITGPTGYGFTLRSSAWTETTSAPLANGTVSTVYTLPARAQVDVGTAFGDLRVQAVEKITVSMEPNRWGDVFGAVATEEIPFPVGIPLDALYVDFKEQFGLDLTVSRLEKWTITMGSDILGNNRGRPRDIGQLLPGVPYALLYDRLSIAAEFGPVRIAKDALGDRILLILDPVDPSLYIRADEVEGVRDPIIVISRNGYIPFHPVIPPTIPEAIGVTDFYSHVFASGGIPPVPAMEKYITLSADGSVDADANDDGTLLAGQGNADELFRGDLSAAGDVLRDINLGANAKVTFHFEWGPIDFRTPLGRASAVLNGQQERFWFRGSKGAEESPLARTPLRFLDMTQQDFIEGTINSDGRFHVLGGSRVGLPGDGELLVQLDIDNEGIAANVKGTVEFSGSYRGAGCNATAGAGGLLAFSYDGSVHMSGSLKADGSIKCKAGGQTIASASFDVSGQVEDGKIVFRIPYIGKKSITLFN